MNKEWLTPGKLILVGEYAVLYGAESLVTAVNRYCRIHAELIPGAYSKFNAGNITHSDFEYAIDDHGYLETGPSESKESSFALSVIDRIAGFLYENDVKFRTCSVSADTSDFYLADSGDKLGLGSSAAFTVCLVRTLLDLHAFQTDKQNIFLLASQVHHAVQGKQGSGIDIAASTFGGICRYQIDRAPAGIVQIEPDEHLKMVTVWSGQAASTPSMVSGISRFEQEEPDEFSRIINELGSISALAVDHYHDKNSMRFLEMIREYAKQLDRLGNRAGIPIISDNHREIGEIAAGFGAAYKPSGAGGGDIGTAFFTDTQKYSAFIKKILSTRYKLVDLNINIPV